MDGYKGFVSVKGYTDSLPIPDTIPDEKIADYVKQYKLDIDNERLSKQPQKEQPQQQSKSVSKTPAQLRAEAKEFERRAQANREFAQGYENLGGLGKSATSFFGGLAETFAPSTFQASVEQRPLSEQAISAVAEGVPAIATSYIPTLKVGSKAIAATMQKLAPVLKKMPMTERAALITAVKAGKVTDNIVTGLLAGIGYEGGKQAIQQAKPLVGAEAEDIDVGKIAESGVLGGVVGGAIPAVVEGASLLNKGAKRLVSPTWWKSKPTTESQLEQRIVDINQDTDIIEPKLVRDLAERATLHPEGYEGALRESAKVVDRNSGRTRTGSITFDETTKTAKSIVDKMQDKFNSDIDILTSAPEHNQFKQVYSDALGEEPIQIDDLVYDALKTDKKNSIFSKLSLDSKQLFNTITETNKAKESFKDVLTAARNSVDELRQNQPNTAEELYAKVNQLEKKIELFGKRTEKKNAILSGREEKTVENLRLEPKLAKSKLLTEEEKALKADQQPTRDLRVEQIYPLNVSNIEAQSALTTSQLTRQKELIALEKEINSLADEIAQDGLEISKFSTEKKIRRLENNKKLKSLQQTIKNIKERNSAFIKTAKTEEEQINEVLEALQITNPNVLKESRTLFGEVLKPQSPKNIVEFREAIRGLRNKAKRSGDTETASYYSSLISKLDDRLNSLIKERNPVEGDEILNEIQSYDRAYQEQTDILESFKDKIGARRGKVNQAGSENVSSGLEDLVNSAVDEVMTGKANPAHMEVIRKIDRILNSEGVKSELEAYVMNAALLKNAGIASKSKIAAASRLEKGWQSAVKPHQLKTKPEDLIQPAVASTYNVGPMAKVGLTTKAMFKLFKSPEYKSFFRQLKTNERFINYMTRRDIDKINNMVNFYLKKKEFSNLRRPVINEMIYREMNGENVEEE